MALPNSYTVKYGSLAAYFNAIHAAEPPDRFSVKFLEALEFNSMNDRAFIGILKELGFLDINNVPTKRYYEYLDQQAAPRVLAEGIKEMFSDLFAVAPNAHTMTANEVCSILRALYSGTKKDNLIKLIAKTFLRLCKLTDIKFSEPEVPRNSKTQDVHGQKIVEGKTVLGRPMDEVRKKIKLQGLQYHINIILPETHDQAVYDTIFKSLSNYFG